MGRLARLNLNPLGIPTPSLSGVRVPAGDYGEVTKGYFFGWVSAALVAPHKDHQALLVVEVGIPGHAVRILSLADRYRGSR
jgi:hypothetical protein